MPFNLIKVYGGNMAIIENKMDSLTFETKFH